LYLNVLIKFLYSLIKMKTIINSNSSQSTNVASVTNISGTY